MRIISIVENLDKGAVENWLVNAFIKSKNIHPDWEWTFYCMLGNRGRLDDLVEKADGTIIYSPVSISNKFAFLKQLRATLKKGQYDIIHAHHDYLSGFYLLATLGIKFKKRIVHVHNTDKALPVGSRFLERMLLGPFRRMAFYFSDIVVGISLETLADFVGKNNLDISRYKVLYYGIDLQPFENNVDSTLVKKEIDVPEHGKLLLFTGRMNERKNPVFVIDILYELLKTRKDVYAVFAGSGGLDEEVEKKSKELGLEGHVRMLGWRNDVNILMKAADVFVFPRKEYPKEGLGLVVVEAQAAGLNMALSYGIGKEAVVIDELAHFMSIDKSSSEWAAMIASMLDNSPALSKHEAIVKMKASNFELGTGARNLISLYEC
ncbi:MAG: glycosyltransferase [Saprospiraceae bacterium]|nr:glycosyltransferase [Saprospiraceae bacterium]